MKPDKAIEILNLFLQHSDQWNHQDLDTAIALGNEALKFYRELEHTQGIHISFNLPGED